MTRRVMLGLAGGVLVLASGATGRSATEKPEDAAQKAAEAWLKTNDAGDYDQSWEQAAKFFKGAVSKDQWKQASTGVRKPLGKLVSRKVKSRKATDKLPGAPDGKYVVIQFDAVFEKKAT